MKKKIKSFDCIVMKREIQARLSSELAGLNAEERIAAMNSRLLAGPFAKIWAARKQSNPEHEKVA